MKKSFWGPKMHISFLDFQYKISFSEINFGIQIMYKYKSQFHAICEYVSPTYSAVGGWVFEKRA